MRFRSGINTFLKMIFVVGHTVLLAILIVHGFEQALFNQRGLSLVVVLYFGSLFLILSALDGLKIGIDSQRELYSSFIVASVIVNILAYFVLSLVERGFLSLYPFVLLQLAQLIGAFFGYKMLTFIYRQLYPLWEIIIVSAKTEHENSVVRKFGNMQRRYKLVAQFDENASINEIERVLINNRAVFIGNVNPLLRSKLVELCYQNNTRFFVLPTIGDLLLFNSHLTVIDDSPCLLCKNRGFSAEQLLVKRFFDVVLSSVLLVLFLPFGFLIALLILVFNGWPIFFSQCRITQDGREFNIIKFRTMCQNASQIGPKVTLQNDKRITRLGAFLRRTHLDEWPQFINVLLGHMSIIGPRAECKENYDAYAKEMPQFCFRTKVKAGVTGFAQVYGRYNTSYEDKLRLDLTYIESASILLDFKILVNSLKVVFWSPQGFEKAPYKE